MGTNNNTPNTPNTLNQYTQSAGETLTYDGNGNLTGDGTNTYTYDAANQMTAANGDTYAYDPFGRRRTKTVDSETTTYIYAGDQAIAEYGASGLEKKFVYGLGIDDPIFMDANSATHYYHADALGSIIAMTDGAGAVAETYRYTAFGQVDAASALGNPYLYTGRRLDTETGLYYYRARYYDAGLRRFLQVDPSRYDDGVNMYTYVGNSPVSWYDPYGLCRLDSNGQAIVSKMSYAGSLFGMVAGGLMGGKAGMVAGSILIGAGTAYYTAEHLGGDTIDKVNAAIGGGASGAVGVGVALIAMEVNPGIGGAAVKILGDATAWDISAMYTGTVTTGIMEMMLWASGRGWFGCEHTEDLQIASDFIDKTSTGNILVKANPLYWASRYNSWIIGGIVDMAF